ncbi:MAG: hypothetical protein WAU01_10160, partial [Saprospiraceae bacterium]
MVERLVKVAKELNVGLSTIVEFLASKGHVVENKPTTMISDEMHDILLKEFRSSMAEKEKADQIVIGTRPGSKDDAKIADEKPVAKPLFTIPKLSEIDTPKEPEQPESPVDVPTQEEIAPPKEELYTAKAELPKLKVLGKIDLDKPKTSIKKAQKEKEPQDVSPSIETPIVISEVSTVPPDQPESTNDSDPEVQMMRAKTPQLKGLKIMGKIDTSKLDSSTKPKSSDKSKTQTGTGKPDSTNQTGQSTDSTKRKRKRKKLSPGGPVSDPKNTGAGTRGTGGKGKSPRDEVKEVSQKEIDDKIKATMARLNVGGKNKRQKIRRD